jgi:predicted transcriptional regulator
MHNPLDLEVRKRIYDTICKYPGIHMRELQRQTGLATGSLDYHLHFMHKNGLIRVEKTGRFTRYYNSMQAFSDAEKTTLSILRQEPLRHVILFLLEKKIANATEISEATGMQPSNLSAHLKSLEMGKIIQHKKKGRYRFYQLVDRDTIVKYLVLHKKSLLDRMVDNFISTWIED